jgi:hypothetical protein
MHLGHAGYVVKPAAAIRKSSLVLSLKKEHFFHNFGSATPRWCMYLPAFSL